jgi:predicted MFS family arabinose efflux permease
VFFVNVPCGLVIAAAAWRIMPSVPRRGGTKLDIKGSVVLVAGLLCLIGPLLFGHDIGWAPWLWVVMAMGGMILAAFLKLEHMVARGGGVPLIDLTLLADAAFLRGLGAAFFFFVANLSFYLVMTLFMQRGLKIPPLTAGMACIPLAVAFVMASRHSGARARHRGTRVLIEGCALQIAGLAALALLAGSVDAPTPLALALTMGIFGYGQGLVMAPLSGAVLSTVKPVAAGSASGMYGTTAQIGNAAGVAAIGAVFFAIESLQSARAGFLVSLALFVTFIMICAAFLAWMRRASARS